MRFRKTYKVFRDPECKGFWHGPHGRYTNRRDADIFAAELIRRLGGRARVEVEKVEIKPRKKK
jgi:hypothetical protein